ncbi:bacteriohemerythrin [Pseudodesulfovibrio tunisiensis]|uniref:bacteriohemerythrin n=1 Tax=Pseudodesulfovibrio tunisiensis TaxID=463192 RepID=UPI001FB2BB00|nr:bacteriohemerythrin [Pseudodesulfovibrio tunisiensis]
MKGTIKFKLILGFAVITLILAAVGISGYHGVTQEQKALEHLLTKSLPLVTAAEDIRTLGLNHRIYEKDFFMDIGSPEKQAEAVRKFNAESEKLLKTLAFLEEQSREEASLAKLQQLIAGLDEKYAAYRNGVFSTMERVRNDPSITSEQANALLTPYKQITYDFARDVDLVSATVSRFMTDRGKEVMETADFEAYLILGLLVAGLLAAILAGYLSVRATINPLGRMVRFASAVAGGDFKARAEGVFTGEMGLLRQAVDTMLKTVFDKIEEAEEAADNAAKAADDARRAQADAQEANIRNEAQSRGLLEAAQRLRDLMSSLTSATEELSVQVEQVARGADVQNARTTETSTAMEQMNASIMEVARGAAEAAENAEAVREKAQSGAGVVADVVSSVNDVETHSMRMQRSLESLGEQAEGIGKIMNVITDIADQTNLLALNAAIEAARAGEAGRGFAVVADEVRKLAEKTMQATKEVGDAVSAIQNGTRDNMKEMQGANQAVSTSADLAHSAGEALEEIVRYIETNTGQIHTIATAAEEQSAASEEVTHALDEVSSIADENAHGMSESAVALRELASLTEQINVVIEGMASGDAAALEHAAAQLSAPISASRPASYAPRPSASRPAPTTASAAARRRPSTGNLMDWDESFSVGVREIDQQHRKLFDLVNALHKAMRTGKGSDILGKVFEELREYTVHHFAHEESLFEEHHYPAMIGHQKEHTKLVDQVLELEKEFKAGRAAITNEVMEFLRNWLVNHIKGTDRKYGPFLNRAGVR